MDITDDEFAALMTRAMDELPAEYIRQLDNVAITYADEPTPEQLTRQGVRHGQLLLGLYEGIPLTQRGAGYSMVLPDKITLFKHPLLLVTHDHISLFAQIKRTLWHEIAYHFGLNHQRIHELEDRGRAHMGGFDVGTG